jgi:hypothetical protein
MTARCKILIFTSLAIITIKLSGQEEIIFTPAELIPHDEGYYISGVEVDEDQDGNMEFHNGCEDYYEDDLSDGIYDPHVNHEETGEQQDFKYFNCLIMPTCGHKGTSIDPPVAVGYIQISACQFSNTDSAIYSYIQSPAISNLVSIYMETSADVSINDSRKVPYNIEYSKDFGVTWENDYLMDLVENQGGYRVTYDGSEYSVIQNMIDASKVSPIIIRIITNDRSVDRPYQGQFVKLHALTVTAEKASGLNNISQNRLYIKIQKQAIISEKGNIEVFNLMGQFIGTGDLVRVPYQGIYLVKPESGPVQKVLVQ